MATGDWDELKTEMEADKKAFDEAEPLFSGRYLITREWEMVLPAPLRREIRDDRVLLWRPYLTLWLGESGYGPTGSMQVVHESCLAGHKDAFIPPIVQERSGTLCGACTLMVEDEQTKFTQPIFSGWVAGPRGYVTMQMYFINMNMDNLARLAWESIRPVIDGLPTA